MWSSKYIYFLLVFLETRRCHILRPRRIFMAYLALILIHIRSKVKLIASDRLSLVSPFSLSLSLSLSLPYVNTDIVS
jgi:hypothetical protein